MRKIEQNMVQAIRNGEDWSEGNTAVVHTDSFNYAVKLHGNVIAYAFSYGQGYEVFRGDAVPDFDTFHKWPTRTTVSRLRALGINASVKQGVPMIDGKPI